MADFVNTIDLLGDEVVAARIIDKTITEYNDDKIPLIGTYAFRNCPNLTSVNIPSATYIGSSTFFQCTNLTSVNLPSATYISESAFSSCKNLPSVSLPSATNIGGSAFSSCKVLTSIILRSKTLCTLDATKAFDDTPFAAGKAGGTVYVPQALITEYQNATNWSTLYAAGTCNFVAIEGSEYE